MSKAFKSNELKLCFWGVRLPSAIGRPDQRVGLPSCKTAQRVHLLGISWYSIRPSIFKTGKSRVRFRTAHVHEGSLALNGLICKSAGSLLRRSSSCYQGLDKRLLCTMQSTPTVHRLQTCSPQFAALSMFSVWPSHAQVPQRCRYHSNAAKYIIIQKYWHTITYCGSLRLYNDRKIKEKVVAMRLFSQSGQEHPESSPAQKWQVNDLFAGANTSLGLCAHVHLQMHMDAHVHCFLNICMGDD